MKLLDVVLKDDSKAKEHSGAYQCHASVADLLGLAPLDLIPHRNEWLSCVSWNNSARNTII